MIITEGGGEITHYAPGEAPLALHNIELGIEKAADRSVRCAATAAHAGSNPNPNPSPSPNPNPNPNPNPSPSPSPSPNPNPNPNPITLTLAPNPIQAAPAVLLYLGPCGR